MKSDRYEPRECEICGQMYKPGKKDQRTCASKECVHEMRRRMRSGGRENIMQLRRRAVRSTPNRSRTTSSRSAMRTDRESKRSGWPEG